MKIIEAVRLGMPVLSRYSRKRGTPGPDTLEGRAGVDVFDANAGGDDLLLGKGGDDIYWLGYGTDHDTINEREGRNGQGDAGDEIWIKDGIDSSRVELVRVGEDLQVRLSNSNGVVMDSLTVRWHFDSSSTDAQIESLVFGEGNTVWGTNDLTPDAVRAEVIRGTRGKDTLHGINGYKDIFDSAGNGDKLYGRSGNDVYRLGRRTGHDIIDETHDRGGAAGDSDDRIEIKGTIATENVRLRRVGKNHRDLKVELVDANGDVSNSLTVERHFASLSRGHAAKVEKVVFANEANETVWGLDVLQLATIHGTDKDDKIVGSNGIDAFDADAGGDDILRGRGGNDVYWLGYGTDHDTINETLERGTVPGDADDQIKLKEGITASDVRLTRMGKNLKVELLGGANNQVTDSLIVKGHFGSNSAAKVEKVVFADGTIWEGERLNDVNRLHGIGLDDVYGTSGSDVFDTDGGNGAGGNHTIHDRGGNDVYWLGTRTGDDIIRERSSSSDDMDEIRIKSGIGLSGVRLRRTDDAGNDDTKGDNLRVELVGDDGAGTDSLTVRDHFLPDSAKKVEKVVFAGLSEVAWDIDQLSDVGIIRGTNEEDELHGLDYYSDTFDANLGGDDNLHGYGGDDTYRLGVGTGHDIIHESGTDGAEGDKIELKAGIAQTRVRLARATTTSSDLHVQLLDVNGYVSDSLTVTGHFSDEASQIERVVFGDETWDKSTFSGRTVLIGTDGEDVLEGTSDADVFDGNAGGDDELRGSLGNDVYWLGDDTDHDDIVDTGGTDEIRVKAGVALSDIRLRRFGGDLQVQLLDANDDVSDSLTVRGHFSSSSGQIERVVFEVDGTALGESQLSIGEVESEVIRGTAGDDRLDGASGNYTDAFDANAGGNDNLHGNGGDDEYWLGDDTDHDRIVDSGGTDKIRIKGGINLSGVRLRRTDDSGNDSAEGDNLRVELVGDGVGGTDSLTVVDHFLPDSGKKVEKVLFAGLPEVEWDIGRLSDVGTIRGTSGNDELHGLDYHTDIFDANLGGEDNLYGNGGDDTYRLGVGTGHDIIHESGVDGTEGDKIELKAGIAQTRVRLARATTTSSDLHVQLLNVNNGYVTDSLKVTGYFSDEASQIEKVVFGDEFWAKSTFAGRAVIIGTDGEDVLEGTTNTDIFDGNAGGNDELRGDIGDDVYWLGDDTDHDRIWDSGGTDEIRIKAGITPSKVRLRRFGSDLQVQLLDASGDVSDSLTVNGCFYVFSYRIERVVFADGTVWDGSRLSIDEVKSGVIRGTAGADELSGAYGNYTDTFDANAGGNDRLFGHLGDNVYWLGDDTDHDRIWDIGGTDEIRIKAEITTSSVRLRRFGDHLQVQLLDTSGDVSDSLTVNGHFYYHIRGHQIEKVVFDFDDGRTVWNQLSAGEVESGVIRGTDRAGGLSGSYGYYTDIFDGNAGGNDQLWGYGGEDVYWLGEGTDHDVIHERAGIDEIRIKAGITPSDVRLRRFGRDLQVQLLDANGDVSDSLTVNRHFSLGSPPGWYLSGGYQIERVVFDDVDETVWSRLSIDEVESEVIRGTDRVDDLYGASGNYTDIFDGNAGGNDRLYGQGGDDEYRLGDDTDHDHIEDSGGTDKIEIKDGFSLSDVYLSKDGDHLKVQLHGSRNSLTVENHFGSDAARKMESIHVGDKVLLENQYQGLIDAIANFTADGSDFADMDVATLSRFWADEDSLSSEGG